MYFFFYTFLRQQLPVRSQTKKLFSWCFGDQVCQTHLSFWRLLSNQSTKTSINLTYDVGNIRVGTYCVPGISKILVIRWKWVIDLRRAYIFVIINHDKQCAKAFLRNYIYIKTVSVFYYFVNILTVFKTLIDGNNAFCHRFIISMEILGI